MEAAPVTPGPRLTLFPISLVDKILFLQGKPESPHCHPSWKAQRPRTGPRISLMDAQKPGRQAGWPAAPDSQGECSCPHTVEMGAKSSRRVDKSDLGTTPPSSLVLSRSPWKHPGKQQKAFREEMGEAVCRQGGWGAWERQGRGYTQRDRGSLPKKKDAAGGCEPPSGTTPSTAHHSLSR